MAWIKWDNILTSYEHGGLGVGSLKAFNHALLQKWHWRFVNNPELLWVKLMKAIHGLEAGFDGKGCYTHGIWANIVGSSIYLHSRNLIPKDTLKCQIGCGSSIRFWKDLWIGDEPLCSRFNRLYRLDLNENCSIRDRFVEGIWSWQWSRSLSGRTEDTLNSLLSEIQHLTLSSRPDTWNWSIGSEGLFAVGPTRAHIDQHLFPSLSIATRWNTCLPRKVNIFIWRLRLDRLPHRLNLSKRGLEIDSILCPICNNNVESNDHIFFVCEVASSAWRLLRIWCNIPDSMTPSYTNWISWIDNMPGSNVKKDRLFVIVASTFWILWKYRNNVTFNSHAMRKCDIFDSIRLFSFNWLKYRGRKVSSWTEWLCNPL